MRTLLLLGTIMLAGCIPPRVQVPTDLTVQRNGVFAIEKHERCPSGWIKHYVQNEYDSEAVTAVCMRAQ